MSNIHAAGYQLLARALGRAMDSAIRQNPEYRHAVNMVIESIVMELMLDNPAFSGDHFRHAVGSAMIEEARS